MPVVGTASLNFLPSYPAKAGYPVFRDLAL
jgi:hypothetical protein